MNSIITVLTPTYNRGYIIEQLYTSLQSQTCYNFEWVVVDDGSTDNTSQIFDNIINQNNNFPIKYLYKQNGGKHRAINFAMKYVNGNYLFIVDSDDYITNDAIENVHCWIKSVDTNNTIAAVSGFKCNKNGIKLAKCDVIENNKFIDASNLEREKMGILCDMAEIYKVSVLNKYPFPEFIGENFITEGVVWDRIANDGYKIRWYDKAIYVCEYLNDGLTMLGRKIFIDNPKGYAEYTNQVIKINKLRFKKKCVAYYEFYLDMKIKYSLVEIAELLNININLLKVIIKIIDFKKMSTKIKTK